MNNKYIDIIKDSFDFKNKKIVIGVSGGRDSVCLLHLMTQVTNPENILAVHVHHNIRGESADKDLVFVRQLANKLKVNFEYSILEKTDKPTADWAREERHKVLNKFATQWCQKEPLILLAHSLDDQIETVMLRFISSPGASALLGMSAVDGNLIRPLFWLNFFRQDCTQYCLDNNLAWRDDPSNEKSKRGKVRNIVKDLKELDSRTAGSILETSKRLREDQETFEFIVNDYLNNYKTLNIKQLEKLPISLARRIVRAKAEELVNYPCPRVAARLEDIFKMNINTKISLGNKIDVECDENYNIKFIINTFKFKNRKNNLR